MILPKIIHRPDRDRWEMHFSLTTPGSEINQVHEWCWNTFGPIGLGKLYLNWDYHGGWLYLYKEKYVTMFLLKWS